MRFACDTGGTFTDLTIEDANGVLEMFKAPTTPDDPIRGVLDVLGVAARAHEMPLATFLSRGEIFLHGTTHAINAIITGSIARTALICTEGHPDTLLLRTGGRGDPFDHTRAYPGPFISRALTFQARERVLSDGSVMTPLDESNVREIIENLKRDAVQAVAVSLLWSVVNPAHELRIGALLEQHLPGVPYTLSHQFGGYRCLLEAADASLHGKSDRADGCGWFYRAGVGTDLGRRGHGRARCRCGSHPLHQFRTFDGAYCRKVLRHRGFQRPHRHHRGYGWDDLRCQCGPR
jgi:N-methylhydantoinase A/oxoprolinase/acetone carboxylase beta subunit